MSEQSGYRGYIGSRSYRGQNAPQHVQNLVIRDFCQRNGFDYLLSATEYHMDGCFIILEEVLRELPKIKGIVMYSIFMLPQNAQRRQDMLSRIFNAGCTLHGGVENMSIATPDDLEKLEELFSLDRLSQNQDLDFGALL